MASCLYLISILLIIDLLYIQFYFAEAQVCVEDGNGNNTCNNDDNVEAVQKLPVHLDWLLFSQCTPTGFVFEMADYLNHLQYRVEEIMLRGIECSNEKNELDYFEDSQREVIERLLSERRQYLKDGIPLDDLRPGKLPRVGIVHGQVCELMHMEVWKGYDFFNEMTNWERPEVLISRTMFEDIELNDQEKECLSTVDEVWVPSQWHAEILKDNGIGETTVVIPEAVDTDYFNPRHLTSSTAPSVSSTIINGDSDDGNEKEKEKKPLVFLSIFKWEWRKGWDVLLMAYWNAFKREDNVVLKIRAYRPNMMRYNDIGVETGSFNITYEMKDFAAIMLGKGLEELPRVEWVSDFLERDELRLLMAKSDCFVLPTRGEGWGLPIVEAMSMGLPAIVTNHSGPIDYLTDTNSYPIKVDRIEENGFAEPSLQDLYNIFKHVYKNQKEMKEKGKQARLDMIKNYSPGVVTSQMTTRIKELLKLKNSNDHDNDNEP